MCGITGIIASNLDNKDSWVRAMNDQLIHRGPDEDGWYSDEHCTLAMRRLTIIDLQTGSQPISNSTGTSLVFFNGEIYNYQELKENLISRGCSFNTSSDTEVLIHLYDTYGENMTQFLNGMFVFCIYNKELKEYFFARDRFGEKPFYYYHRNDIFVFSSEVKSLLCCPLVPKVLNTEYLQYYFTANFLPEPHTLLKGVYSLPPGFQLKYACTTATVKKYYTPGYLVDHSIKTMDDAVSVIRPVFQNAIKRQMHSDVPLGAFLSGGIDSSALVATMQQLSNRTISTFNVKFEETTYDESKIAQEVADFVGTDHHQIIIPNAEFNEEIFWNIIDHVGLPFPDSSAIPTYYVTREIRKHVKVALSGDGGDELFAGYDLFNWYKKVRRLAGFPNFLRSRSRQLFTLMSSIPVIRGVSKTRQIRKALGLSMVPESELPLMLHAMFDKLELRKFNIPCPTDLHLMNSFPEEYSDWSDLRKIMYYRLKYNLPLDMLTKVDRMSMANSLEVRAPFLDCQLFEASSTLPEKFLMQNGIGKLVIREMMKNSLPSVVFNHPKTGFSIPLHKYQNQEFLKLTNCLFFEDQVLKDLVSLEFLKELVSIGINQQTNNAFKSVYKTSHQLWSLLQLAGWIKRFGVEREN